MHDQIAVEVAIDQMRDRNGHGGDTETRHDPGHQRRESPIDEVGPEATPQHRKPLVAGPQQLETTKRDEQDDEADDDRSNCGGHAFILCKLVGLERRRGLLAPQARMRGAAVALSPVFGVPVGSIRRICTSPRATGRCSTPMGTTNTSPGLRVTVRSRSSMSSVPLSTRKRSSVSSCLCQWKGPSSLATMISLLL